MGSKKKHEGAKKFAQTVKKRATNSPLVDNEKTSQLKQYTDDNADCFLTSNQGVRVADDQNTLKAGARGPSLLEDHLMREKIMHFDHERIPERVVHARGSGAHGTFESYGAGAKYSRAAFLQAKAQTPVFVRFSTVAGFRGSSDLARDVRGFATKFYTEEGIFDLVGNNMPVFFIQDAIKFPDLIHAVKPEPHNEIPQAQSAHDTFWDFVSLSTEATHMVMWIMSDRALPRSFSMMEGFGVHTFRLIDQKGVSRFAKFHWKPVGGVHSILWDEALKISGKDPDFHRRDLFEAIESGNYPEFELGVQIIEEKDEFKFDFDLLDPTKLVPEELVPVEIIGKMTLNRNPENFFAETEQVAFCVSHIVPGIDFTDDPLMQGRLFSYPDTQLKRLGGPNFHEIPINKSVSPVRNNQRDGHMRQAINAGKSNYEPNTIGGGCPFQAGLRQGGFVSFAQPIDGTKVRDRSESFLDHFSQATLFWNSQTDVEKQHIVEAFQFELGKVDHPPVRERMIAVLERVDTGLAQRVAEGLGIKIPVTVEGPLNMQFPADVKPSKYQPQRKKPVPSSSPALSILGNAVPSAKGRKVAILVADGFDAKSVESVSDALTDEGAMTKIVAVRSGKLVGDDNKATKVDFGLPTVGSVLFDALFIPGGAQSIATLKNDAKAILFVNESYKHGKAIGAVGDAVGFLETCLKTAGLPAADMPDKILTIANGITINIDGKPRQLTKDFVDALSRHRFWNRLMKDQIAV